MDAESMQSLQSFSGVRNRGQGHRNGRFTEERKDF